MRIALAVVLLGLAGCSHSDREGTTAGESVPRPQPVIDNAIPRDLPPATPPIPATSRSAQQGSADAGENRVEVEPGAPPFKPLPTGTTWPDAGWPPPPGPTPPEPDPFPSHAGGVRGGG